MSHENSMGAKKRDEYLEMDKMLANEKANEKVVALDEYRKAS